MKATNKSFVFDDIHPEILSTDSSAMSQTDPLDSPLEERLVLNDMLFSEARNVVTVDEIDYSFLKTPYMNFEDQLLVKRKLKEAYTQGEFLLLYGYSGCGKTTVLTQFASKYPCYAFLIKDFANLSPAQMLIEMGRFINVPLKQRTSEIFTLQRQLKSIRGVMYLFDQVNADTPSARLKLENLRKINEETGVPIIICGVPKLFASLYDTRHYDDNCSIISRLDEHEMRGMRRQDAGEYLNMIAKVENIRFTYPAQQALIATALNTMMGGINAFTTILGRSITLTRVTYYNEPGRSFPDHTKCVRPASPSGKSYPGAELVVTPPPTPDTILIDEHIVSKMQSEYKAHFPRVTN